MTINTTRGPKDTSELRRLVIVWDDGYMKVTTAEYCMKNCEGEAHSTRQPDGAGFHCKRHVHRSVHVDVLKMPDGMSPDQLRGVVAAFQ
jgi:hypothetical protein